MTIKLARHQQHISSIPTTEKALNALKIAIPKRVCHQTPYWKVVHASRITKLILVFVYMMAWIKMNFPSYDMRFEMNNMIMCCIKLEISHKDKVSGQYVINDFLKAWSRVEIWHHYKILPCMKLIRIYESNSMIFIFFLRFICHHGSPQSRLSFLHMNSSSYGAPLFVDFKFFLSYSLASFFFSFSFLSFYLVIFGMTFMKLFDWMIKNKFGN